MLEFHRDVLYRHLKRKICTPALTTKFFPGDSCHESMTIFLLPVDHFLRTQERMFHKVIKRKEATFYLCLKTFIELRLLLVKSIFYDLSRKAS